MPVCINCSREWHHLDACHCFCHETFVSVLGFDAHRKTGVCVPPASIGLIRTKDLLWAVPGEPEPAVEPPKRRGRPKGSKNKPKSAIAPSGANAP